MKGSVMDMIGVILLTTTGAVTLFAMYYLVAQFNAAAAGVPMFSTNADAMGVLTKGQDALRGMDALFALFVILICGVTLISAFMLPSHPILFIIGLILTLILIPVAAMFANMFEAIYSSGPLVGVETNFPFVLLVFQYLPTLTAVIGFAVAVLMYGRMQAGGGY